MRTKNIRIQLTLELELDAVMGPAPSDARMAKDYVRVYNSLLQLAKANLVPNQAEHMRAAVRKLTDTPIESVQ